MATGKKRRAHPSYSIMMSSMPKHQGPWKPGKRTRRVRGLRKKK